MSSHRFTDDEVREIRERYAAGEGQAALAEEYGVVRKNLFHIVHGHHYPDAPGPIAEKYRNRNLDEDSVCEIREKYAYGHADYRTLAEEYGASRSSIRAAIGGKSWRDAPGPIMGDDYRVPARTPGAEPIRG